MRSESERSTGQIIEKDPEEVNFHQKVEEWRDGPGSYDEVRDTLPSHDRFPLIRTPQPLTGKLVK